MHIEESCQACPVARNLEPSEYFPGNIICELRGELDEFFEVLGETEQFETLIQTITKLASHKKVAKLWSGRNPVKALIRANCFIKVIQPLRASIRTQEDIGEYSSEFGG